MRDDPDEQEQVRRLCEHGSHSSAPVTPPTAAPPKKVGRNKAFRTLEPENTPPRPPSGPRSGRGVGRGRRVHRWSGLDRRRPAGCRPPPHQPIVFCRKQFYRWGSWICYLYEGVNPPEADYCFYQPVGGPHVGARCGGNRAAGSWCPDDNILPWSPPEEWRNADRLRDYEDDIPAAACEDDDRIAEAFTSRMREIAERKEAKAERKRAAMAAIQASLLVGGWLCPGCEEWNLSFRNLCYKCNGKRTAAGVLSRGVPDAAPRSGPRRV